MRSLLFQTDERAKFFARNMPRDMFRISPNADGLTVLTYRVPNETLDALETAHANACGESVESDATRGALAGLHARMANAGIPGRVISPSAELARLKRENAEMRRTVGTLADALENHASYKATFLNLMVRNARTLIGA
jgi:hypothetical protein